MIDVGHFRQGDALTVYSQIFMFMHKTDQHFRQGMFVATVAVAYVPQLAP